MTHIGQWQSVAAGRWQAVPNNDTGTWEIERQYNDTFNLRKVNSDNVVVFNRSGFMTMSGAIDRANFYEAEADDIAGFVDAANAVTNSKPYGGFELQRLAHGMFSYGAYFFSASRQGDTDGWDIGTKCEHAVGLFIPIDSLLTFVTGDLKAAVEWADQHPPIGGGADTWTDPRQGVRGHALMTAEVAAKVPPLGTHAETETADLLDLEIPAKLFSPYTGWTWYIMEMDFTTGRCYGLVHGFELEFGDFDLDELAAANVQLLPTSVPVPAVERDCYYNPVKLWDVAPDWMKR